jgi:hypothetical protein
MAARTGLAFSALSWKQAYLDAILEKDPQQILVAARRAEAEFASREHQLFGKPEAFDELQDISDARYLLQALISSLAYRDPS